MYVRSALHFVSANTGSLIGLVNVKAIPLLAHYKKWFHWKQLIGSNDAFGTPEYIPGNQCVVVIVPITNRLTGCNTDYILTNLLPAYAAYRMLRLRDSYKSVRKSLF